MEKNVALWGSKKNILPLQKTHIPTMKYSLIHHIVKQGGGGGRKNNNFKTGGKIQC